MIKEALSKIISGGSLLDKWRRNITDDQVTRACEILSLFGLDRIYGAESLPDVDAARAMLAET